ncbi:hypothetical protein CVT91_01045 [Candidatus Atribacteria bacterium HGW-Atribacteria-1]|nr:MAG: hypothetical protein CVT91_01045 [Candidatus Atribacteria bacterium HGW-Atribacteria-1]
MIEEVKGGQNIYGEAIGIITVKTKFPRIPGDIGNATTWDFPVMYRVVKETSPARVVGRVDPKLLEPFIEAARDLEKVGVKAITTTCGFLALFQEEISNSVNVPVFTSSLMQVPLVYRMLRRNQKVGIITIDSGLLTKKHLAGVGADSVPTIIVGTEDGKEFNRVILENEITLNVKKARADLVTVAKRLVRQYTEVGAIVLECTNMPPYARSIQQEVGLPVFDIYTLINMVYSAVVRKDFTGYL